MCVPYCAPIGSFKYQGNVVSANRRNTISNTDEINRLLGAQKIATFTDNNYQSTSTKIHRNLIPVFTQPEIKVLSLQPNQRFFFLKKKNNIIFWLIGRPPGGIFRRVTPCIFPKNMKRSQNNTRGRALLPIANHRVNPPILFMTGLWPRSQRWIHFNLSLLIQLNVNPRVNDSKEIILSS